MNLIAEAKKELKQEQLQTENSQLRQTVADLQEQMQQLSLTNEKLTAELRQTAEENAKAEAELTEQDKKILDLSSRESALRSEMQQMAEQIVKLNESDLIVKQNEELRNENSSLKLQMSEVQRKAREDVKAAEMACTKRLKGVADRELRADERERKARELIRENTDRQEQLDKEVAAKCADIEAKNYKKLKNHYGTIAGMVLGYAALTTVYTGATTEAFVTDFKAFWLFLWQNTILRLVAAAEPLAAVSEGISTPILSTVCYWAIIVVVVAVVVGIVGFLLLLFVPYAITCIPGSEKFVFYDEKTGWQLLITAATVIWFATPIREAVPINLLLLFLLIHAAFLGIRVFLQWRNG